MSHALDIFEILAQLLRRGTPYAALTTIGELIILDAKVSIYGLPYDLDKLDKSLEDYTRLAERCHSVVQEFAESRDGAQLTRSLTEILQSLRDFDQFMANLPPHGL